MPYKVSGTTVMVLRRGRWVALKRHKSKKKAEAHAAALNRNVRH